MTKYFYTNLLKNSNRLIFKAINEYGHNNFKLSILEYCDPKFKINREQYYINILNPKYNLLKIAGSSLGYIHREESKLKISKKLGIPTIVLDTKYNKNLTFLSRRKASLLLKIDRITLKRYIQSSKLYKNRYIISNYIKKN